MPIQKILEYSIPIGDWVLHLQRDADKPTVELYLTWKDKDTSKHEAAILAEDLVTIAEALNDNEWAEEEDDDVRKEDAGTDGD